MKSEWKKILFDDIIEILTDYHANGSYKVLKENVELLDTPDYAVMIRTTNFENNMMLDTNLKYITEDAYNYLKKTKVFPDDIIMNKIANPGTSYFMPDLKRPVSLAMNLFLIRVDISKAIPRFIYYYLRANEAYVKSFALGSVTQTITKQAVRDLEINLPSMNIQKKITNVIGVLEDKIELNRKMNQTLEAMAQALFKSWFVDFDPVHAKAGCRGDAELEQTARELGISKEVLELFPSAFVESEMGMIPEGWEIKKVSELVSKSNTGADAIQKAPIVDYDTGIRCARVGDFSNNRSLPSWGFSKVDEKNYKNYKLIKNDILITRTSLIGLSKIIREDIPAVYNNGLIRIKPTISAEFLYINFQSNIFKTYISRITGESSTRPNMKINYLLDYKVVMPDEKILTIIHNTFFTLLDELDCNIKQIDTLQKTRDTLLPKLLSGELDVSEINITEEN